MTEPPRVTDAEFTVIREADPPPASRFRWWEGWISFDWKHGLLIGAVSALAVLARPQPRPQPPEASGSPPAVQHIAGTDAPNPASRSAPR